MSVITNYVKNAVGKDQRAFKIGIFTIFLCVTVITFFVSLTSITPILFVKFG